MASRNKPPTKPSQADFANSSNAPIAKRSAPYDFGETMPLPEVIEKDSDSVWAMWTDATQEATGRDAETIPATLIMGLPELPKDPDTP